jgi:hypothetical protein
VYRRGGATSLRGRHCRRLKWRHSNCSACDRLRRDQSYCESLPHCGSDPIQRSCPKQDAEHAFGSIGRRRTLRPSLRCGVVVSAPSSLNRPHGPDLRAQDTFALGLYVLPLPLRVYALTAHKSFRTFTADLSWHVVLWVPVELSLYSSSSFTNCTAFCDRWSRAMSGREQTQHRRGYLKSLRWSRSSLADPRRPSLGNQWCVSTHQ